MGTKDITTRRLEEYNDVFADIINVLVFKGERRVLESDLTDVDTRSEFLADDKGLRSQDRDVAKFWTAQNIRLALFGLENQTISDASMPLRLYSYNGASYKAQIIPDKKHEDKQSKQSYYPVLTLVLYFGLKRWDTAKTLYEAHFFKQLRLRGDTHLDMQDPMLSQTIQHFFEFMRLMRAYSHDSRFELGTNILPPVEDRTMLAVLTRLEDQGIKKGRREGLNELNWVYANLLDQGRNEDLMRAIKEPEFQKKILEEFGFTEEEDEEENSSEPS